MTTPKSERTEVFISYSHKDAEWLERLHAHLRPMEREGKVQCWDDTRIRPGAMWQEEIRSAVAAAKVAVLLVSADFLASDFIATEELPPLLTAAKDNGAAILPVIVSPSQFEKASSLSQFQAVNLPTQPLVNMTRSEQEAVFVKLTDTIAAALNPSAAFPEEVDTSVKKLWNVPLTRNRFFTGRKPILTQIYDALHNEGRAALSGIGGVGKTQIAVEYAYQHKQNYEAVFWARADTREALISSFVAIAELLNLLEKDVREQDLIVRAVKQWLVKPGRLLLILDNADDLVLVHDFIPVGVQGHLVLTTRAQAIGGMGRRIPVEPMMSEDATLFLLRRSNIIPSNARLEIACDTERKLAETLFSELGGLPLALDQAGAFIEEKFSTLEEYLGLYQNEGKQLRELRGEYATASQDHPKSITVTFSLAFKEVVNASPAAADLLRLCAFLHPEPIPEELFVEAAPELSDALGAAATNPLEWVKTRQEACRLSLLHSEPDGKTLTMHRLVQAVIKDEMNGPTQQKWAERTVRAVNRAFPSVEFANWSRCERLLPHVQACKDLINVSAWQLVLPEAGELLNDAGVYLRQRGRYREAEPLYQQALALWEKVLGPEHADVWTGLNNLAALYYHQGRYEEAKPLYQRILAAREKALGLQHPDVGISLNNLAELYREQGRYREAEPLYQRALVILEKALGTDHPRVATALNNLSLLNWCLAQYQEAETLCQRALAIREKIFGFDHPDVATSLTTLAVLCRDQRRYMEAEHLFLRALTLREKIYGPENLNVANSLKNLALLYSMEQRYQDAELHFQRGLAILEKTLGPDHPEVAIILENYVSLLHKTGRETEAKDLEARAEKIHSKTTREE
jgi:tetratricopeptide (TPR) repeat protein